MRRKNSSRGRSKKEGERRQQGEKKEEKDPQESACRKMKKKRGVGESETQHRLSRIHSTVCLLHLSHLSHLSHGEDCGKVARQCRWKNTQTVDQRAGGDAIEAIFLPRQKKGWNRNRIAAVLVQPSCSLLGGQQGRMGRWQHASTLSTQGFGRKVFKRTTVAILASRQNFAGAADTPVCDTSSSLVSIVVRDTLDERLPTSFPRPVC